MTTHNLFDLMADVTGQHHAGILLSLQPPKQYWPHAAPQHRREMEWFDLSRDPATQAEDVYRWLGPLHRAERVAS